jgi:Asp-tRNA(Asn)/Glu-tRNA(Gln) amidotransferase A subunit family amidase
MGDADQRRQPAARAHLLHHAVQHERAAAASINCGYTKEGKPIGLQISGRRFDDSGVMRLSRWYEQARGTAEAMARTVMIFRTARHPARS